MRRIDKVNIDKAQQMYMDDPVFHQLVDMIEHGMHTMNYTPGEVRAAAMLAAIRFEQVQNRPKFMVGR